MKNAHRKIAALLALLATPALAQQPDLSALMGALGSFMGGATNEAAVAVVDFREMRAVLPESIGAFKRTKAGGEKSTAMGMTISMAEGQYAADPATLSIKMVDYGGTGMGAMMASAWSMSEIDRESDTGYERTTEIKGHKAIERYDNEAKYGEIQILVAGRFMVEIESRDGKPEDLQAAATALDLDKLAALKK